MRTTTTVTVSPIFRIRVLEITTTRLLGKQVKLSVEIAGFDEPKIFELPVGKGHEAVLDYTVKAVMDDPLFEVVE